LISFIAGIEEYDWQHIFFTNLMKLPTSWIRVNDIVSHL